MASAAPPEDWGPCRVADCDCGEGRFAGGHNSESPCTRCPHPRHKHSQPAGPAAGSGADSAVLAKLSSIEAEQKALKEQGQATLKALEAKRRREIVLSDIDSDGWHDMLVASGFSVDATTAWPDALSERLLAGADAAAGAAAALPPAFQWDASNEPDQKARYLPYLRTHLRMEQRANEAALVTLDNDRSFLSVSDRRLHFDIKGTTDVAVVHQGYIAAREEGQGVLAVLELKKACTKKDTRQTIGQLIAADLISRFTPLAVLTDLREEWHFYWLEGRTIKHLRPPPTAQGRQLAFLFLQLALAPGFVAGEQLIAANAAVDALPVSVGKRRKLSPVKEDRPRHGSEAGGQEDSYGYIDAANSDRDDDEDRQQLLYRQVRKMIRHTPWLQDVCRPAISTPLSAEAQHMFG